MRDQGAFAQSFAGGVGTFARHVEQLDDDVFGTLPSDEIVRISANCIMQSCLTFTCLGHPGGESVSLARAILMQGRATSFAIMPGLRAPLPTSALPGIDR